MKYKTTLYARVRSDQFGQALRLATFHTSAEALEYGLAFENGRQVHADLGNGMEPHTVSGFVVTQWCDSSEDWYPLGDCPCMEWQKDTRGNWGRVGDCADTGDGWASRAFAGALGDDSTAPACWKCGASERIGDYCKACLTNQ
jgi:hypothetical protein